MSSNWSDLILKFVNGVQTWNYNNIIFFFLIYIVFIWIIVTGWVYIDAKRRFDNIYWIIFNTIFILPFNFPWLIIYVLLRPENTKKEIEVMTETFANIVMNETKMLPKPERRNLLNTPKVTNQQSENNVKPKNLINNIKVDKFKPNHNQFTPSKEFMNRSVATNNVNNKTTIPNKEVFQNPKVEIKPPVVNDPKTQQINKNNLGKPYTPNINPKVQVNHNPRKPMNVIDVRSNSVLKKINQQKKKSK